jgi:HPt (histidine-containing phosphotransfer) domain-containing protein
MKTKSNEVVSTITDTAPDGNPLFIVLDEKRFLAFTGSNDGVMRATASAFIKHMPTMTQDLTDAAWTDDRERVRAQLHKIKSATGLFASPVFVKTMTVLESNIAALSRLEMVQSTSRITETISLLREEVRIFLENLKSFVAK